MRKAAVRRPTSAFCAGADAAHRDRPGACGDRCSNPPSMPFLRADAGEEGDSKAEGRQHPRRAQPRVPVSRTGSRGRLKPTEESATAMMIIRHTGPEAEACPGSGWTRSQPALAWRKSPVPAQSKSAMCENVGRRAVKSSATRWCWRWRRDHYPTYHAGGAIWLRLLAGTGSCRQYSCAGMKKKSYEAGLL